METKASLALHLSNQGYLWCYDPQKIKYLSDEIIIEHTLKYADIPELKALFTIFDYHKIEQTWINTLIPDPNLKKLNHYLSTFFFTKTNLTAINHESRLVKLQSLIAKDV